MNHPSGEFQEVAQNGRYLMALHSSSETLGVAVEDLSDDSPCPRVATFSEGRRLSSSLLRCVQDVLPASSWSNLRHIAVAIGPGGFTGTRLTVVMARTLAQQLDCPLLGVSSFALMAARLSASLTDQQLQHPFWVVKPLVRRGTVAGRYRLTGLSSSRGRERVEELEAPHLLGADREISPILEASDDVESDVRRLLELCAESHLGMKKDPWREVLPVYPTSPVGSI